MQIFLEMHDQVFYYNTQNLQGFSTLPIYHQARLPRSHLRAVLPVGRDRVHPDHPHHQPRHLRQASPLCLQMLLHKQAEIQD